MKVVPIIPAFNPENVILDLINELKKDFKDIIVVNDGSINDEIFKKMNGCIVLTHKINQGKGASLKTAFKSTSPCSTVPATKY